jgi:hypothetical protein
LNDDTGGGPGATGIAVSANSMVAYTGSSGAGAYTNGGDGEVMAAASASAKAAPKEALYFAVRSSMHPDDVDDNGVYQMAADGTTPTQDLVDGCLDDDLGGGTPWFLRGGSGS